jgi:hypothetical protein
MRGMGVTTMSYDQRCYSLAQFFLAEAKIADAKTIELLAAIIQGTIEDFIADTGEVI